MWPPRIQDALEGDQVQVEVLVKRKSYRSPKTPSSIPYLYDWDEFRWPQELILVKPEIKEYHPYGGMDVCIMRTLDGELTTFGIAICAMADLYTKRGSKIAFSRARELMMTRGVPTGELKYVSPVIDNIIAQLVKTYYR
jgi:hypothetical protein